MGHERRKLKNPLGMNSRLRLSCPIFHLAVSQRSRYVIDKFRNVLFF